MEDDTDEEELAILLAAQQAAVATVLSPPRKKRKPIDHRCLPREEKKDYKHERALGCILEDYLCPQPLFDGREFETMFRISRGRFQCLMEDFKKSENDFYSGAPDCFGHKVASLQARLLLPLKCMAYGVPPHCFRDYFQMSKTLAKDCCNNFHETINKLYTDEYLRAPTAADLKAITRLHKAVHGLPGMLGSLDCMHVYWDKCPVAWQGAFKNGAKKKASIVLEGMSDFHLFLWHEMFGFAGTLNDLNILNLSPLLDMILNGELEELEKLIPNFIIMNEIFEQLYMLVDGIYPLFSRFVKGYKEPIGELQTALTKWQESARKDIERAFGVLQAKFQCVARPIVLRNPKRIEAMVQATLVLHNMCVLERIMGNCHERYDPSRSLVRHKGADLNVQVPDDAEVPQDREDVQAKHSTRSRTAVTGFENADEEVVELLQSRRRRWVELHDKTEAARLHNAIMSHLVASNKKQKTA